MKGIYRRKYIKTAGVLVLLFLFLSSAFTAWYGCSGWIACIEEKKELSKQMDELGQLLYVADCDISKGTVLTESYVTQEVRYTDLNRDFYIGEEDFGKILVADIKAGTCLMDMMLEKTEDTLRDVFVSEIDITEQLEAGKRIDVRICYGNGEDYIVLADKVIKSMDKDHGMVLSMTEEEILMLASAMTDAQNYRSVRLYAVKYPEQEQYQTSAVTYIPKKEILSMLGKESTEGESRNALEERLLHNESK